MLVMGSPRIRSPTLWRLAIAEVEEVGLGGSAVSSQSEHGWTLRLRRRGPLAPGVTCRYAISVISAAPTIPRSGEVTGDAHQRARARGCEESERSEAEDRDEGERGRVLCHRLAVVFVEQAVELLHGVQTS